MLRKRENFREAFSGFDPERVVEFGERDIERLMGNAGIIRHRGKIRSTINNAARALEMADCHGSLAGYFWDWGEFGSPPLRVAPPGFTEASKALAKELQRRGWTFVGPTTCYAFMQAMGLVNDHLGRLLGAGRGGEIPSKGRSGGLDVARGAPNPVQGTDVPTTRRNRTSGVGAL